MSTAQADSESAMLAATTGGQPVEDLSQRDEVTRVYANPDGTWTAATSPEPEQVQDPDGVWHDVDVTLVEGPDGLAPKFAASDVVFSDGGSRTFASMTRDGTKLDWMWPTVLPKPTIANATATYHDVVSGGDLTVTATPTGFTHSIVLRQRPASALQISIAVVGNGATLVEQPSGAVAVESSSGESLAEAPRPLMWDSATSPAPGQDESAAPVEAAVQQSAQGNSNLVLSPSQTYLSDPETVYPVTVDPSFTTYATGDTWIQSPDYPASQIGSPELRVGTFDGGAHVARTFLHFDTDAWNGTHILSADLVRRNFYSYSCTGAVIRAARIKSAWSTSSLTWGNQPAAGTTYTADYAEAKGFNASCDVGDSRWNVRDMVQDWADGNFVNNGIRLAAYNESNSYSWRKYRSNNFDGTGDGTVHPKLYVTYNNSPNPPGSVSLSPGGPGYTLSAVPRITARLTDPDYGSTALTGTFEVLDGTKVIWTGKADPVSNGGTASVNVPADLLELYGTYSIRVTASDGIDTSVPSVPANFVVDAMAPLVPAPICATGCTATEQTLVYESVSPLGPGESREIEVNIPGVADIDSVDRIRANLAAQVANSSGDIRLTIENPDYPKPVAPTISTPSSSGSTSLEIMPSAGGLIKVENDSAGAVNFQLSVTGWHGWMDSTESAIEAAELTPDPEFDDSWVEAHTDETPDTIPSEAGVAEDVIGQPGSCELQGMAQGDCVEVADDATAQTLMQNSGADESEIIAEMGIPNPCYNVGGRWRAVSRTLMCRQKQFKYTHIEDAYSCNAWILVTESFRTDQRSLSSVHQWQFRYQGGDSLPACEVLNITSSNWCIGPSLCSLIRINS